MEGIALTGAWVDAEQGLLGHDRRSRWAAARACAPPCSRASRSSLMGPTGAPTEIPASETVLLCRRRARQRRALLHRARVQGPGRRGCSTSPATSAARTSSSRRTSSAATDQVIWCTDTGAEIAPRRPQDRALPREHRAGDGRLRARASSGGAGDPSPRCARIIAIGQRPDDERRARGAPRRPARRYLDPRHLAIGSINSPMQCMMKEVCAQCLQKHVDPVTGQGDASSSPASTRTRSSTAVDFRTCARACARTRCRRSCRNAWLDEILKAHSEVIRI